MSRFRLPLATDITKGSPENSFIVKEERGKFYLEAKLLLDALKLTTADDPSPEVQLSCRDFESEVQTAFELNSIQISLQVNGPISARNMQGSTTWTITVTGNGKVPHTNSLFGI